MKKNENIKEFYKILIIIIVASFISLGLGILFGSIFKDFSKWNIFLRGIIWILNVFISYTISFFIGKLFKLKIKFFSLYYFLLTYVFSVILVIIFSNSFDFAYVASFFVITSILEIVNILMTHIKNQKNN